MSQFHLVCRKKTNGSKCLTTISSETKDSLLAAALEHASSVHGMGETRGLKDEYKMAMKKGAPPA
jgi:hypothetical protein